MSADLPLTGRPLPLVSICTTTYDHERYIGDCIESVLAQKVDFPIEMVIGEDCSKDGTREIVRSYARRHPDVIRLLAQDRNLGAGPNFVETFRLCHGSYVAMLDGDDYWTSPDKLAGQVALLEQNPDWSMCFHPVWELEESASGSPPRICAPPRPKRTYHLDDLHEWINIYPTSVLFRRDRAGELPPWYATAPCGDWPLWVFCAERGPIGFSPEPQAVHRIHASGVWSSKRADQEKALVSALDNLALLLEHLPPERHAPFLRARCRRLYDLAHLHASRGERDRAWGYVARCLRERGPYDPTVSLAEPLKSLLAIQAPVVLDLARRAKDSLRTLCTAPAPETPPDEAVLRPAGRAGTDFLATIPAAVTHEG